jgi:hypothetical protein
MTEIRKNVTESTPLMAMVGATDLAAERVREVAAGAGHLQEGVEKALAQLEARPRAWRAMMGELDVKTVQQAPVIAIHRVMEWAEQVEDSYEHLAERGKGVVERARQATPTQDFVQQGKATIRRAKAAVTSARKTVGETVDAARDVLTIGRREAREVVGAVEAEVADSVTATEKVVSERTQGTRDAVRDVARTVRRRAASTRTATRTATTSARRTAMKAVVAVETVAGQIGEEPAAPAPAPEVPASEAVAPAPVAAVEPAPVAPVE